MAVNLTGLDLSGTTASSTHKTSSAQNTASNATQTQNATQQPQEEVSVTSTASLLSSLHKSLASRPAVDQSRVAAISNSIASGTYKIDSHKIAHGLIDSERALGKLK